MVKLKAGHSGQAGVLVATLVEKEFKRDRGNVAVHRALVKFLITKLAASLQCAKDEKMSHIVVDLIIILMK